MDAVVVTVFFMPVEELRKMVEKEKRTRNKDCFKAFEKLEKIREILEE